MVKVQHLISVKIQSPNRINKSWFLYGPCWKAPVFINSKQFSLVLSLGTLSGKRTVINVTPLVF